MTEGMRIPLARPDIGAEEIAAVAEVLRSGRLSMGPEVAAFEAALAAYTGAPYAAAVSSGTAGLHLALLALGIGPGDEVITTPLSFVASANVILHAGASPVFVDVDPHTLNLDPALIEAAITPRTRAILVVHLYGRPASMGPILELAARHGLRVVEDACEALGARSGGRCAGTLGDVGVYAFYANKQITTAEGGMVVGADPAIDRQIRALRNQGRDGSGWADQALLGYNCRLSELHAALGRVQLERIEALLARREAIARRYTQILADLPRLQLPAAEAPGTRISWFVYVIRLAPDLDRGHRDRILAGLQARGIGCAAYFPPIHLQPYYRTRLGYRAARLPHGEAAAERVLALPFFTAISDAQIETVCASLRELLARV